MNCKDGCNLKIHNWTYISHLFSTESLLGTHDCPLTLQTKLQDSPGLNSIWDFIKQFLGAHSLQRNNVLKVERPYLPTTTLMPNNFDTELDSVDPGECLHSMIISNHIIQKTMHHKHQEQTEGRAPATDFLSRFKSKIIGQYTLAIKILKHSFITTISQQMKLHRVSQP